MDLQTVIFIGRSGAGKGMQSGKLQELMKENSPETTILYMETGAHFRRFVKEEKFTWERARIVNDAGGRQPDFLAVWIWGGVFVDKIQGNEHIILDGTPRSVSEAEMLDTALAFYKRKSPAIIFLNVSEDWAEERLRGRGRPDDLNPEVVARRLAFFNTDVAPALEYYRAQPTNRFFEINGEQSPDAVFSDMRRALGI